MGRILTPTPSFQTGFARCAGECLYPMLWDRLIAWWDPGVGPTGDTLLNFSPYGTILDAALNASPTWEVSELGWLLHLNGTTQYATVADRDLISFGRTTYDLPFSASMWVSLDSPTTQQRFFGKGTEWLLTTNASSEIGLYCYDNGTAVHIRAVSAANWNTLTGGAGNWAHLGASYDGSGSETGLALYVNGTAISVNAAESPPYVAMHNNGADLLLGDWSVSGGLDGLVGPAGLWGRVLVPQEFRLLADVPHAPLVMED